MIRSVGLRNACIGLVIASLGSCPGLASSAYAASVEEAMSLYKGLPSAQQQQLLKQYQGELPSAIATSATQAPVPVPSVEPRELDVEKGGSPAAVAEPVSSTSVQSLKPFGYELFAGEPMSFAAGTDVPVPLGYVIGPGDVLNIQVFGKDPAEYKLLVSRQGVINFPQLGPINVLGQSFESAKEQIESQVASQLIGARLHVSLGQLRSMRVFVLGDAYRPGSYSVSALSNISNALFVSGGIRENGSLRNIQLKRRGRLVQTLDLYDFLLKGDNSKDITLQEGDVVFIPPVGPRVWVDGEVNRPAIYELKGDASLSDVIRLAGGATSKAVTEELQLSRVVKNKRRMLGFDLTTQAGQQSQAEDGDQVLVPSIINQTQQQISLSGYLARPGLQPLRPGMRLSDLVRLEDLQPQTDLNFSVLRRIRPSDSQYELEIFDLATVLNNPDSSQNLKLRPHDELVLLSLKQSRAEQLVPILEDLEAQMTQTDQRPVVSILGHVRNPGRYPFLTNMGLAQLLSMARGTPQDDEIYPYFGVIERAEKGSFVKQYSAFSPRDVLSGEASIGLTPGSRVFLFNKQDVRYLSSSLIPSALQVSSSSAPSALQNDMADSCSALDALRSLRGSERAARLVTLTFGNNRSYPCASMFSSEPALLPFALDHAVSMQGEFIETGLYPVIGRSTLTQLTRFAGGVTGEADLNTVELQRYSVLNQSMETHNYSLEESPDLVLQSGDVVMLRPRENGLGEGAVRLSGEFKYPGLYSLRLGESLSQLIKRAGGLTEQAYPYGAVFSRQSAKQLEQKAFKRAQEELRSGLFTTLSSGRLQMNGGAASSGSMELYMQLLNQISSVEPIGRVVIEADPSLLELRPELDMLLEAGDQLFVPKRPSTVSVVGQVLNPGSLQFKPGTEPGDYIEMAGGLTQAAESSRAFVVLPNGSAKPLKLSAWNYTDQNIPPGSTLIVPRDLLPFDAMIMTSAVTDILSKVALTAAALNSISN